MVAEHGEVDLAAARPDSGPTAAAAPAGNGSGATANRSGGEAGVRRRPKDRKAQIVRAAARAFSERGYYPVGVDEIAAEVGISGPALYRHFANKYALLVAAAEEGARHLLQVAQAADDPALDPEPRLDAVIKAISEHTIDIRREAGLYRWERRYLEREDRLRIRRIYDELNDTIAAPIARLRPGADPADLRMLSAAVMSAVASIAAHRTALSGARLLPLLRDMCWAILRTELPPAPVNTEDEPAPRGLPVTSKREQLLTEAIRIFGRQGYHEASIEEIGAAVGINASSVYRYFSSKADLLAAAFHRTGDRVSVAITEALAEATSRPDAVRRIAARQAKLTFAMPEIMPVYYAEFSNLPQAEQHKLRAIQRQNVLEWANLLDGDPIEARFRVHAAIGQVIDVGRLIRFDSRPAQLARVTALMEAVLLG
ncbi:MULTISPECIES: TetR/AcrR family transcriptional regulator [Nocardia]|uniref:TetR/AcrR family transcriptional regulator n=1 Tax=Nocardia TaxID=1817 RepID=UPI000BEF9AFF|nr:MULTISPECIES: TetR/AcrR family transcriptional regulator [Nocardia]MBF6187386.1 TetR/AcrR family transcriptional regulator [Nocardia farcinica]MBF6314755.1 TetR/AcrR family transcriptional regulator [Nocardia farcinica]MBF6410534.1 TetR/AcrR family transcriptional regulator [Nocardia farcinica]PEH78945.1 TetR family transcriptional regulator [Nocardia sp. FDAARGOS_372]UEX23563.1 TetR/AcrR family transcriptional regulator [Nocardia farcinica]